MNRRIVTLIVAAGVAAAAPASFAGGGGGWGTLTLPGVSPDLEGRIGDRPFHAEMVVLAEGTDAVDRLALIPDADEEVSCATLLGEARPKIEIAACGAVCLRGARFGERPGRGAVVTDFGVVADPLPAFATVSVTVTSRDAAREEARGHLRVEGPGFSVRGPFSALYCPSRLRRREAAAPIHGLAWGRAPVAADDLPSAPLAAVVAGRPFALAAATLVPAAHGGAWDLLLHGAAPAAPCASGEAVFAADAPDALRVRLAAKTVAAGSSWSARSHLDGEPVRGDPVLLVWHDPGRGPVVTSVDWNVTVAWDEMTDDAARGRLYAAFEDTGKSFLVGAFTATVCPAAR